MRSVTEAPEPIVAPPPSRRAANGRDATRSGERGAWQTVLVVVLALVALSVLGGCSRPASPSIALSSWSLRYGDGAPEDVQLPRTLKPPAEPGDGFSLRTRVTLPADLRGRDLELVSPRALGVSTLHVGGERIESVDNSVLDGPHRLSRLGVFPIPARLTDTDALELVLSVRGRGTAQRTFRVAPQLGPSGISRSFRIEALVYLWIVIGSAAIFALLGAVYLALFAARRDAIDGHYGALCASLTAWSAVVIGLVGWRPAETSQLFTFFISLFTLCFFHELLDVPRPRALVPALTVLQLLTLPRDPPAQLDNAVVLSSMGYAVVLLARSARSSPRRFEARLTLASFLLVIACFLLDADVFFPKPTAIRLTAPAFTLVFLAQGLLLVRRHVQSLRGLADELSARVVQLEAQGREVAHLNTELRGQIERRSRELADALARLSTTTTHVATPAHGDRIDGRYEIVRELGRGGMGAVFEVTRIADGKRLALKVLTTGAGPAAFARFAREAQVASQVAHPNVVSFLDLGVTPSGLMYLVMELVDGPSLEDRRARFGDVAWGRPVLAQAAQGLAALHARGVVHRDVKPGNVLLDERRADVLAKIADFGIARPGDDEGPETAPMSGTAAMTDTALALTASNMILGTPRYIAPEVATRGPSSPASDVFAFGVMAFEVLTGELPFETPPLAAHRLGVPFSLRDGAAEQLTQALPAVAPRILACLRAEPGARPSARELAEALQAA